MLSLVCQPHPFHFLTDALAKDDTGLRKKALFDGSLLKTRREDSHPHKGRRE